MLVGTDINKEEIKKNYENKESNTNSKIN